MLYSDNATNSVCSKFYLVRGQLDWGLCWCVNREMTWKRLDMFPHCNRRNHENENEPKRRLARMDQHQHGTRSSLFIRADLQERKHRHVVRVFMCDIIKKKSFVIRSGEEFSHCQVCIAIACCVGSTCSRNQLIFSGRGNDCKLFFYLVTEHFQGVIARLRIGITLFHHCQLRARRFSLRKVGGIIFFRVVTLCCKVDLQVTIVMRSKRKWN